MNETTNPIWGKEGIVTAYMCMISYDDELENSPYVTLYPSVESLKLNHGCADDCGIVKISVRAVSTDCQQDSKFGYMPIISFNCELGGAKKGTLLYSSEEICEGREPQAKKFGICKVEVRLEETLKEQELKTLVSYRVFDPENEFENIVDFNRADPITSKDTVAVAKAITINQMARDGDIDILNMSPDDFFDIFSKLQVERRKN